LTYECRLLVNSEYLKKLIKANSLYLIISLLSSSSAILLIPLYINYFSVSAYGELALMNTTFSLLAIILTMSVESAFQTYYFDYEEAGLKAYFSSIYSFAILMALIMSGLMAFAGPFIFRVIFSSETMSFYPNGMLITLSVVFTLINQIYFVKLRNQEKIKRFGKFVAINTISSILLQIVFIVPMQMGVTGAILGALIGNVLVFLCTISYTGVQRFHINWSLIRKSLKYCAWLIPFFLINWFVAKGDRMVVENLIDLEAVGIYALLMNIAMIISILTTSVLNSIRPTLFREFKKVSGFLNTAIVNITLYFIGIIGLVGVALYFFVQNLHRISLFENYVKVQDYILLALILFGLRGLIRFVSEYLSFRKKSRDMFLVSLANLAIYLPLLIFFASRLDLKLLLLILIVSNAIALIATTGRCYYLLKFQPNA
jgi:O-antigen/teichoic acid export membrane protein